jgi:hypothetical protein
MTYNSKIMGGKRLQTFESSSRDMIMASLDSNFLHHYAQTIQYLQIVRHIGALDSSPPLPSSPLLDPGHAIHKGSSHENWVSRQTMFP